MIPIILESSGSISCFYCGVSIRGLEPGDDVWAQHAEYFPDCEFLKLHKGEKFIQRACDLAGREDTMVSHNNLLSDSS